MLKNTLAPDTFQQHVLNWYHQYGRKHLPWQQNISPYKVWLSEVMLQQTQVNTVIPYFEKFMQHFPNIHALATADIDWVLSQWAGLGYYARARNLHKTAQIIDEKYHGEFPQTVEALMELPGIGRSTAGAIIALAHQKPASILDGNVKRVLARCFVIDGWVGKSDILKNFWAYSEYYTPTHHLREYTQAMMDLGAMICTRTNPNCTICPLKTHCVAFAQKVQEQYPTKKPKKSLPIKTTMMIVIENTAQQILLKKRPSSGIWGGLWCLPEFETRDAAQAWLKTKELHNTAMNHLTSFRHTFTHFHLDIEAYGIHGIHLPLISDKTLHWVKTSTLADYGKPAAIERILREAFQWNYTQPV